MTALPVSTFSAAPYNLGIRVCFFTLVCNRKSAVLRFVPIPLLKPLPCFKIFFIWGFLETRIWCRNVHRPEESYVIYFCLSLLGLSIAISALPGLLSSILCKFSSAKRQKDYNYWHVLWY